MLSISVLDLLPEAAEEIGFVKANLFFYLGVAFFALVVACIPEPDVLLGMDIGPTPPKAVMQAAKRCGPGHSRHT